MPKQKDNTERVNVFFRPQDLEQVKKIATQNGMTVSGYIRYVVLTVLNGKKK